MDWAWNLGRIAGIDFKIHFTFPLIVLWIGFQVYALSGAGAVGFIYGMALAVLLFACVLLHELGHSLTAMRYGIKVKDITLTPIGGVAQLTRMPDSPRQELAITAAGPAVNFVIAALLWPLSAVLPDINFQQAFSTPSIEGMVAFLLAANISMGIFNLLPAFPMDGGRIFRALLSLRLGQVRATNIAVSVGQVVAVGLGLWGIMTGNISMVLIAVFVFFAGAAERQAVSTQQTLARLNAGQAVMPSYVEIYPDTLLYTVMDMALRYGHTSFAVTHDGQMVGVVSRERMLESLQARGPYVPVGEIMQAGFTLADANDSLLVVQQRMTQTGANTVGVMQNGRLLGLLTQNSIVRAYNRLMGARPEWAH